MGGMGGLRHYCLGPSGRAGFMVDVGELNQNIVSEGGRPEGVKWLEAWMVTMLRR